MTNEELEMLASYIKAINIVGGASVQYIEDLNTMTVGEMIKHLAPNGVRFTVEKGKK